MGRKRRKERAENITLAIIIVLVIAAIWIFL